MHDAGTMYHGEPMKLWFPNVAQWVVMWLGLVIAGIAGASIGESYQTPEGALGAIFGVMWVVIATVFVVWMIEARRRKSSQKDP
jgi:hypothetical protein